jgi:hypothetical protein
MAQLLVTYDPLPIPWVIRHDSHGHQTTPGRASVVLTVRAIDADTFAPVAGNVDSVIIPTDLVTDPNDLHFPTNEPQHLVLIQMTSREVPPGHRPVFDFPSVKISANGYADAFLMLDDSTKRMANQLEVEMKGREAAYT